MALANAFSAAQVILVFIKSHSINSAEFCEFVCCNHYSGIEKSSYIIAKDDLLFHSKREFIVQLNGKILLDAVAVLSILMNFFCTSLGRFDCFWCEMRFVDMCFVD